MVVSPQSRKRVAGVWASLVVLTISVTLLLEGVWLTAGWALLAAALTWAGFYAGARGWPEAGVPARLVALFLFSGAAVRLTAWEVLPGLFDQRPSTALLRAATFLACVAAFYLAVWAYGRFQGQPDLLLTLAVAANLLTLLYITMEIVIRFDLRNNGIVAGNREMLISAAWGLYGLLLALADRRFPSQTLRDGARFALVAALGYLVMGALQNNGRWATTAVRYGTHFSVLGSVWGSELLFRRYPEDRDRHGLLAFAAMLAGVLVCSFEVERALEPTFKAALRLGITEQTYTWMESTAAFWRMSAWGAYGLLVWWVGNRLSSGWTRLAGVAILGLALASFLLSGARTLATAGSLRLLAFALTVPVAGTVAYMGLRVRANRRPFETAVLKALAALAGLIGLAWLGLECL